MARPDRPTRRRALALAVLCALVPWAAPAQEAAAPQRSIAVSGTGEAAGEPDLARLEIGVTTERESPGAALSANSDAMEEVIAAIRGAGVAERDVATTSITLMPVWSNRQRDSGAPEIVGYRAGNRVSVTVRAFDRVGPLLDAAGQAGATDLGSISFDISDKSALEAEARRAAIRDARARAELYAEAAGVGLGRVLAIEEAGVLPRPMPNARMALSESASSVPVAGGELAVRADVSMLFEIVEAQ